MKLTASPHFPEKRIGYLGMLLLLTEEADVLMLATNALKNDLNSENKFVAGLALCAIGNLATADMSRDLAPEVDKHLKSPLPYLRKKACLALARCLTKCPELVEDFIERIVSLLKDKSHGVLITVLQLMTQVLMIDHKNAVDEGEDPYETPCRQALLRLVPSLAKTLRNLLSTGFAPDHDVGGISDPFLQVQILTLFRLLGASSEEASEEMNDVLAQLATNTDSSKNAGNAILYECVQTIMGIQSEDGLRVLAVNILGRFLLNRDNNIRYVALNTLSKCIVEQKQTRQGDFIEAVGDSNESATNAMAALQRHRTTVVDCLKDPDISIRQRALELIYHLVNESNVEALTAELLNYLVLCPREHRADICTRILKVVDRFSPNDQWRVDTLITTLTIAGREASPDFQNATVVYISRASPDIQAFATHKLLKAIRDDDGSQFGLSSVGIWCIGEYGDMLLQPYTYSSSEVGEMDLTGGGSSVTFQATDPSTIVSTIEEVTKRISCPESVKQRALTAYAKLGARLSDKGDPAALDQLERLLHSHQSSRSLELQLRSCEYNTLMNAAKGLTAPLSAATNGDIFGVSESSDGGSVSNSVMNAAREALARMPVVDAKVLHKRLSTDEFSIDSDSVSRPSRAAVSAPKGGGDLLDLDDIFGGGPAPVSNGGIASASTAISGKSDADLLADIFSASPAPAPASVATGDFDMFSAAVPQPATAPTASNPLDLYGAAPAPAAPSSSSNLNDLFGSGTSQPNQTLTPTNDFLGSTAAQQPPGIRVPGISHSGLSIEFECTKPDPLNKQKSLLIAHFTNSSSSPMHGVNLQCAVPKHVAMTIEPPTSTTVPPMSNGKPVTQKIMVTNSLLGTKNLMLKLKISFSQNGEKLENVATCSGFPDYEY